MIFILIAGTEMPFCLLCLTGTMRTAMMVAIWGSSLDRDYSQSGLDPYAPMAGTGLYIFLGLLCFLF